MTVQTTDNRVNYIGDAVTASFAFNFEVDDASWIKTYEDGVLTIKNIEVVLNADQDTTPGGVVNFLDPAPAGVPADLAKVTIERLADLEQGIDYNSYDGFPADTHENGLDKLTYLAQQNADAIGRAIVAPVTDDGTISYNLPAVDVGKALKWNDAGDGLENSTDNIDDITTEAQASADASEVSNLESSSSAGAAATSEANSAVSEAKAQDWADEVEDVEVETGAYSAKHHAAKAASFASNKPSARNKSQNKEPMTQGISTRTGMSSTLSANDDGLPSAGFIKFSKDRNNIASWVVSDSLRGNNYLSCDTTAAEVATIPALNADDISFGFDLPKTASGVTNRNKAYSAAYNPDMNCSAVAYEGDGVDGHEIPHHLGVIPELRIAKDRDSGEGWIVKASFMGEDEYLRLDTTDAIAIAALRDIKFLQNTISLDSDSSINSTNNFISYNFASKSGVCKIGKYIGTGAAGNYVSTEVDGGDAFKPQFVMVKGLDGITNWYMHDNIRGQDEYVLANTSSAEANGSLLEFDVNGFHLVTNNAGYNALNEEYIFMAFAETNIDATKSWTDYDYATTADTISIENNTLVSLANGFNANGQADTQYEFIGGKTLTFGVGHENLRAFIHTDKLGNLGYSLVEPLSGLTRNDCDKYGLVSPSDESLRTTDKHFDYESASGVAFASGESAGTFAYNVFNKDSNDQTAPALAHWIYATNSQVQYKFSEARIPVSWRMRNADVVARSPKRFTIECQNEGDEDTWVEVDVTYKAGTGIDYVPNGIGLWGDLHELASSVAYDYMRINTTVNNGDATYTAIAELEFNTISAADYMLIGEGIMYDSSDVAQERMYLGELITDDTGDVILESIINYPVAEQEVTAMKVHQDLTVYGDIINDIAPSAMIRFDGVQNPPLEEVGHGGLVVVDGGLGIWEVHVPRTINLDNATWGVTSEYSQANVSISRTAKTIIRVRVRQDAGAYVDTTCCVQIFGGKL